MRRKLEAEEERIQAEEEAHAAAGAIQRLYRDSKARAAAQREIQRLRDLQAEQEAAAAKIQAGYRGQVARVELRKAQLEAETERARNEAVTRHEAAARIQAVIRGYSSRQVGSRHHDSARKLQAVHRGRRARRESEQYKVARVSAATQIQASFRGRTHRESMRRFEESLQIEASAVKIQSAFRGKSSRSVSFVLKDPKAAALSLSAKDREINHLKRQLLSLTATEAEMIASELTRRRARAEMVAGPDPGTPPGTECSPFSTPTKEVRQKELSYTPKSVRKHGEHGAAAVASMAPLEPPPHLTPKPKKDGVLSRIRRRSLGVMPTDASPETRAVITAEMSGIGKLQSALTAQLMQTTDNEEILRIQAALQQTSEEHLVTDGKPAETAHPADAASPEREALAATAAVPETEGKAEPEAAPAPEIVQVPTRDDERAVQEEAQAQEEKHQQQREQEHDELPPTQPARLRHFSSRTGEAFADSDEETEWLKSADARATRISRAERQDAVEAGRTIDGHAVNTKRRQSNLPEDMAAEAAAAIAAHEAKLAAAEEERKR